MFAEVANSPAKVIEEFRKSFDKPLLKLLTLIQASMLVMSH